MARAGKLPPILVGRLFAPVDIAPLVWFRVAFGGLMLVEVYRYFANGWIERYFIEPSFLFKYYGFEWIMPWPGAGMQIHFVALGALAICIAVGYFYRLAALLFFLGFTYVFLLEQARYLNHFYLVCLYSFLMILVPAHHAWSLDAKRRPRLASPFAPAWTLWILRAQICVVYFFGGVAKLNSDWLHGEPLRMWLARRSDYPIVGSFLTEDWCVWLFTYGGLLFDLGIVPLLLWSRTRTLAFVLAALFNLTNAWIFQIGIFPWFAFGATFLLFAPNLPLPGTRKLSDPRIAAPNPPVVRAAVLSLVGVYLAAQFLIPLRHWIYPGDVNWTEEGHRFSWRMKLRDKTARLIAYAHDPASGQTWRVSLLHYVNRLQLDEASVRPDMILQLCHHIADDFRARYPLIQIRVRAQTSLNGRSPALLIDPDIDLASEERSLRHARWITSLNVPLETRNRIPRTDESRMPSSETSAERWSPSTQ